MTEKEHEKILLEIRTALADYAHSAWSGWMKYIWENSRQNKGGSVTIPKSLAEKLEKQMLTDFDNLPEDKQKSNYEKADKIMEIIKNVLQVG